jgi:hypothetical protein
MGVVIAIVVVVVGIAAWPCIRRRRTEAKPSALQPRVKVSHCEFFPADHFGDNLLYLALLVAAIVDDFSARVHCLNAHPPVKLVQRAGDFPLGHAVHDGVVRLLTLVENKAELMGHGCKGGMDTRDARLQYRSTTDRPLRRDSEDTHTQSQYPDFDEATLQRAVTERPLKGLERSSGHDDAGKDRLCAPPRDVAPVAKRHKATPLGARVEARL